MQIFRSNSFLVIDFGVCVFVDMFTLALGIFMEMILFYVQALLYANEISMLSRSGF